MELIPEINKLWHRKGIRPKQHYSEPRPGAVSVMERRAHSDRVARLPDGLPDDMGEYCYHLILISETINSFVLYIL